VATKLKIDLSEGILEVEGTEAFVTAIYNDFKAHFVGEEAVDDLFRPTKAKRTRRTKTVKSAKPKAPALPAKSASSTDGPAPAPAAQPESKPEVSPPKPEYTFLEDLDLSANKDQPSLVEFMDAKIPFTNEERNLVFVYYLHNIRKIKPVTMDHIFTCYKAAKLRVPVNLEKSLHMAANWINITKTGRLTASAAGTRYVEKQLPKKVKN
jgi:hypothetical protein